MDGRSLGPRPDAGAWLHQSLCGSSGQEPSLPLGITSRLAGIRGGPRGAVSDVGDPTERLTSLTAFRLPELTTLYGSQSDADSTQGVSPDSIDSISWAASPPRSCSRTTGRNAFNGWGPRPRRERPTCPCPGPWGTAGFRAGSPSGSPAAGGPRLVPVVLMLIFSLF